MRRTGKSFALVILVSLLALAHASAAEQAASSSDPGEQIKQGFIGVGHGIRDGAVKAWGAVKSAFDGNGSEKSKASDKQKSSRAPSDGK